MPSRLDRLNVGDETEPNQLIGNRYEPDSRLIFDATGCSETNIDVPDVVEALDVGNKQLTHFFPSHARIPDDERNVEQAIMVGFVADVETVSQGLTACPGRKCKKLLSLLPSIGGSGVALIFEVGDHKL